MQELVTWYVQGKVKVVVDEAFAMNKAVDALSKIMSRKVMGKVILLP